MKTKIKIFLITFLPLTIFSQNISDSIVTGKIQKCKLFDAVYKYQPVASFDNCFTFLLLPKEEDLALGNIYRMEKYDLNLNLLVHERLNFKDKNGERKFCNLIYFQQKLYLFTSFKNHKDKKLYLFVQTIDKNKFSLNDDLRMIAEFENKSNRKNIKLNTSFSISEDSTKLLISATSEVINHLQLSRDPYGKELENSKLFVCVFDKNVNLLWQQEASKAINSGTFVFDKFTIDNSANAFITGQSFENKNQAGSIYCYAKNKYYNYVQPSNYKNSILYFGNNGNDLRQLNIDPQGIFAKSVVIKPKGDNIICAGIYASPNTISAKGVYSCQLNLISGKTDNLITKQFSNDFLVPQIDEEDLKAFRKQTKKEESDPYTYSISKLEQTLDGNYLFIAEQQLSGSLEVSSYNSLSVFPTLKYGNLYVSTLSPTGEIKNINVIDKKQFSFDYFPMSYSHLVVGNDLYLLFNNIPKNKKHTMFDSTSSTLQNTSLIKLDKDNKQTKEIIADFTNLDHNTMYGRIYGTMPVSIGKAFIIPIQSSGFLYRTYQKLLLKP